MSKPSNMTDAYDTIGYALKRAQQALRSHMDRALKDLGLTAPQYAVLASLEAESGASNAALSKRAFVTPQTMQGMLVKLERAGLIARKPDAEHGRIQRTLLTKEGKRAVAAAHVLVSRSEALAESAIAPFAKKDVLAMLKNCADRLA